MRADRGRKTHVTHTLTSRSEAEVDAISSAREVVQLKGIRKSFGSNEVLRYYLEN